MAQARERHKTVAMAWIALGGNLPTEYGPPQATLRAALAALDEVPQTGVRVASGLYATPCMPAGAGPDYVNAVAGVETGLTPEALLAELHRIEAAFDRKRVGRWGARTLDLDLLDHGGVVLPDLPGWRAWAELPPERQIESAPDRLILPHPRIADRGFVLVPLAQIAPDWTHPVTGARADALAAALPAAERDGVRPLPSGADPAKYKA